MKKIVFLLLVVLTNLNICFAQKIGKIHGQVIDSLTCRPIEFANVMLMTENSNFIAGVTTDSLGTYEIESSNINDDVNYIIQVTHISYGKKSINFHQNSTDMTINMPLVSNNISLQDVTITGIRTKVKNRINFNYTFTDQMKDKVKVTSKLLENIPTVFVDCNSTIHIKGSSNILILKNGIELSDNSLVDQIQPNSVKSVEIMYNIPSQYANRNYTAVMNIVTQKEQGYALMLDNKTAVNGSMNDTKVNIGFDTEKSSMYLFYKLYYRALKQDTENKTLNNTGIVLTDEMYTISPRKECDNEFFYGYSLQPNKKIQVGIDGYLSLYRERFPERYDDFMQAQYAIKKERVNTQNYKGYVDYKDEKSHFTTEISFNKKDIKDDDKYFVDENLVQQNENQNLYGVKVDYNRKNDESNVFYSGIKYSHKSSSELFNNIFSNLSEHYHCDNLFVYGEYMKSIGEHWIVDCGLSFQKYQRIFDQGTKIQNTDVFPKFKISYSLDDNSNFALGYSSYLKEPSVWQMLSFIKKESSNMFTKGNPYLKPEKKGTFSLEYSYSKGDFYLETSNYLKHTRNQIVNELSIEDDNTIIKYVNIDKSYDYGIDLSLSCNLTKWWSVNLYGDACYRSMPSNNYYKKNDFMYMVQVQNSFSISSKTTAIVQYARNGRELMYNGYNKPYDSSLCMINYTINDYIDFYMLFIQPLGNMKGQTRISNQMGTIDMTDTVHSQQFMLCLTFSLNKGKKIKKKKMYQDESKKH